MYPEDLVAPMRAELTNHGAMELRTSDAVDAWVAEKKTGLLVINSVCGCAAGMARPGVVACI
jgi:putative YphP/YqiW family bacilliredoxin